LWLNNLMEYSSSMTVQDALRKYYLDNQIPLDGGGGEKWATYKIGPFQIVAFPNFAHRMSAIARHDVHHVVNQLETTSLGEGLIAAWELGSGCGKYWISWCMEPQALWWGILMAPRRTFSLFLLGRRSRNFYHEKFDSETLNLSVGQVRTFLLPKQIPSFRLIDGVAFFAAAILGLFMIAVFIPIYLFFSIFSFFK